MQPASVALFTGREFFHHKELLMDGYKRCRDGDGVRYVEAESNKGLRATDIEVYESNWPFEQDYTIRKSSAYQ